MTFRAGQKVECVDDGDVAGQIGIWLPGEEIREGEIYTVASIFLHPALGLPMVRLREVVRSQECALLYGHDGYGALRFRPIVSRETDISVFTKMLTPQGVEA